MKYLKRYNESIDDLKYKCDSYMSHLVDKGFSFEIEYNISYDNYSKRLHKDHASSKGHYKYHSENIGKFFANIQISLPLSRGRSLEFLYSDIKDDFLTFLEMLSIEYKIDYIKFRGHNGLYSLTELLNPKFKFNARLHLIEVLINKKDT